MNEPKHYKAVYHSGCHKHTTANNYFNSIEQHTQQSTYVCDISIRDARQSDIMPQVFM